MGSSVPSSVSGQRVSTRGVSLPSAGSRRARFPDVISTMKTLRLPARAPGSLWIRFQAPRVPPFVRARRSAPTERGGRSAGLGVWSAGVPLSGVLHPWARAGHHRFPGNPSYALALLQDPGRADKTSPLTASSILPPGTEHRRPQRIIISRLTQGFSIRCLRFKSGVAAAPAKLASGWRAAPLPGGGRTLWTASKGFRLHRHPPFQDFACRNQFQNCIEQLSTAPDACDPKFL